VATFNELRAARIGRSYDQLKALDYEAWRRCVDTAGAVALNCGLTMEQAASIEGSMVELVLGEIERRA